MRSKGGEELDPCLLPGPTYVCTFGTGDRAGDYDVHRTGIALYLNITNVGSAASDFRTISVGYHWHIHFSEFRNWLRFRIGWFWLTDQTVIISDFQVSIGDNIKVYPFLTQRSALRNEEKRAHLTPGMSTSGVVYFEQNDSFGGCFPSSRRNSVRIKVVIEDVFGGRHNNTFHVDKVSLADARKYNPKFGLTHTILRGEVEPIELPKDTDGNIVPLK